MNLLWVLRRAGKNFETEQIAFFGLMARRLPVTNVHTLVSTSHP